MKQTEHQLQVQIVSYLKIHNIFVFAVPNGFFSGAKNKGAYIYQRKLEGFTPGVSDLIMVLKNRVVFLELKTKSGKQSLTQKEFEKNVKGLGYEYYLVRSLEEVGKILNIKVT